MERRNTDTHETIPRVSRDVILDAVTFAAQVILQADSWQESIDEALERLGRAAEASRVYIFENETDEEGSVLVSQRYEWAAPGITPQIDNPEMQKLPCEKVGLGEWLKILQRGGLVAVRKRDLQGQPLRILESQDILALLLAPIFVGEGFWGFLGFDDCLNERGWSPGEKDALYTAARILGAGIRRQKTDETLSERTTLLENILRSTSDLAIATTDLNLRITYFNSAAEKLFGYSAAEVVGRTAVEMHRRNNVPIEKFDAAIETARRTGEFRFSLSRRTSEGLRELDARVAGVFDSSGRLVGFSLFIRDVTDQKRDEEKRRKFDEQMQQIQKLESLGIMAGGIAHDFNNLLMGVLGNAELALETLPKEDPSRAFVKQIEKAARRAADLTQKMLAYSGHETLELTHVDLTDLVREMAQLAEASHLKSAIMERRFPAELPLIHGDPTQLRQVIMNLIVNACEALGEGEGFVRIETGVMEVTASTLKKVFIGRDLEPGRYVYFEVSDTGCGMDPATLQRIYDPFFTTKFPGRGLGLAAVMGIVRSHQGAIITESAAGEGSTFRVIFPEEKERPPQAPSPAPAADHRPREIGTLLLVDDEECVLSVTRMMLEKAGFEVVVAPDGARGIERFQEDPGRILCVVLDMTMPGMSGDKVFQQLRRIRPDVPIVICSGFTQEEVMDRFSGSRGRTAFIQKPYEIDQLIHKIHDTVKG